MFKRKYKVPKDYMFNLNGLPIEIIKRIIDYKINEIKLLNNDKDILSLIKSILILYKSCKLFNSVYNSNEFWSKCWDNYKILNTSLITTDIDDKTKLLLHIQEECQNCNSNLQNIIKNKVYDGLNVRYCINCYNTKLISDFSLENYYNLTTEDYTFPFYNNKISTNLYDENGEQIFIINKMFFKKDIEENIINMRFEEYNRQLNIQLIESINFEYNLFNINYFIDKLGFILEGSILDRDYLVNCYNIIIKQYNNSRIYYYILNNNIDNIDINSIIKTDYYRKLIDNVHIKLENIDFNILYRECCFNFFINDLKNKINNYHGPDDYSSLGHIINKRYNYIKDIYYNNILSKNNNFCFIRSKKLLIKSLLRNDSIMCYHCIRYFKTERDLLNHNKAKHNKN